MRIGVDARALANPSAEVGAYLASLLQHMAPLVSDDEIVLFHDCPRGLPHFNRLPFRQVKLRSSAAERSGNGNISVALWLDWVLPRGLRHQPVDAVLCPNLFVPPVGGLRKVAVTHDLAPLRLPGQHNSRAWLAYFRAMLPRSLDRADTIIAPSQHVKDAIVARFGANPDKIAVVPYGVEPELLLNPAPGDLDRVRRRFGIRAPNVLFVGENSRRKNLATLARAVARLRRGDFPSLKLVISGTSAGTSAKLDAELERLGLMGAVVRTGPVSPHDLACLYRIATVFAMPSLDEGFGMAAIQAMACGAPVVVSNKGALPEVTGGAAITIDPEDVEAWATAIARVLTDDELRSELAERGTRRSRNFSWEQAAAQTLSVLGSGV